MIFSLIMWAALAVTRMEGASLAQGERVRASVERQLHKESGLVVEVFVRGDKLVVVTPTNGNERLIAPLAIARDGRISGKVWTCKP